jgi:hypothetical protein
MMLESFPQWILNLFIIQGLQVYETLNIVSTCISAFSVVYGLGDWLAYTQSRTYDYPFSKTLWGMLTIVVDVMLRGIFLAYIMTIVKVFVLLIPTLYLIVMLITVLILKRNQTHKMILSFDDAFGITASFVCSAHEHIKVKYTIRLMSKCIFSTIIIVTAIILGITYSSTLFYNSKTPSNFSPSNCTSICQPKNQTETETQEWKEMIEYCDNIWKTVSPETHIAIWAVLGLLLVLSVVEGILEQFYPWMPYRKLYAGSHVPIPPLKVKKTIQNEEENFQLLNAREAVKLSSEAQVVEVSGGDSAVKQSSEDPAVIVSSEPVVVEVSSEEPAINKTSEPEA